MRLKKKIGYTVTCSGSTGRLMVHGNDYSVMGEGKQVALTFKEADIGRVSTKKGVTTIHLKSEMRLAYTDESESRLAYLIDKQVMLLKYGKQYIGLLKTEDCNTWSVGGMSFTTDDVRNVIMKSNTINADNTPYNMSALINHTVTVRRPTGLADIIGVLRVADDWEVHCHDGTSIAFKMSAIDSASIEGKTIILKSSGVERQRVTVKRVAFEELHGSNVTVFEYNGTPHVGHLVQLDGDDWRMYSKQIEMFRFDRKDVEKWEVVDKTVTVWLKKPDTERIKWLARCHTLVSGDFIEKALSIAYGMQARGVTAESANRLGQAICEIGHAANSGVLVANMELETIEKWIEDMEAGPKTIMTAIILALHDIQYHVRMVKAYPRLATAVWADVNLMVRRQQIRVETLYISKGGGM